jgi:thioredoxin-like negative regulator of GroEL
LIDVSPADPTRHPDEAVIMLRFRDARPRFPTIVSALVVASCSAGVSSTRAQSVQWRTDYNSARKEASEKGRPILLEFATENCMWCKKLDLTTFRDPAVAKLLNEQFISLKVDADRESTLTQMLRITQYPTLVVAGPDGKIIGVLEGYQEPAPLSDQLQKVSGYYAVPEWMVRDYQESARAILVSEYGRAIAILKNIVQDGKERTVQVKARLVLRDLEQQAAGRLARAKALTDRGQSTEAAEALTDLLKNYVGTQAAADGGTLLTTLASRPEMRDQQRQRRARELLAQARDDFREKQYIGCLERCETLTSAYSDLPEGSDAQHLAAEIRDNPEFMAKVCESLNARTGAMYLTLAETWIKKGQPEKAQLCLEKVLQSAPESRHAELAQVRLAQLQGTAATQQTEYKKR